MTATRVLVTGSADGLGLMAARLLAEEGHQVTLHARSAGRAEDSLAALPGAADVFVADISTLDGMRSLADQANRSGPFDGVIHNAGLGQRNDRHQTVDCLSQLFAVNVVAPYLLTALMARPDRLVYLSSNMHRSGDPGLGDLQWADRRWDGTQAYSDSKLFDTVLAFAVARLWPGVRSNAVDPGWVATKMGGAHAPDDLRLGGLTQAWLAVSGEPAADRTGELWKHQEVVGVHPAAADEEVQAGLLAECERLTGVALPG